MRFGVDKTVEIKNIGGINIRLVRDNRTGRDFVEIFTRLPASQEKLSYELDRERERKFARLRERAEALAIRRAGKRPKRNIKVKAVKKKKDRRL